MEMDINVLDKKAMEMALRDVKNMLQRPGQLEKVDQFRNRTRRKKAMKDAMLKTAMQNQLDGVSVGQKQLASCLEQLTDINTRYYCTIGIYFSHF